MKRKIFFTILISFIVASFLKKSVFIADTPRLRQDLSINSLMASIVNRPGQTGESYKKITNGVYARETATSSTKEYRMNEITWVERKYIVNGKEIIIKIAKGDTAPSQMIMEQIYK